MRSDNGFPIVDKSDAGELTDPIERIAERDIQSQGDGINLAICDWDKTLNFARKVES